MRCAQAVACPRRRAVRADHAHIYIHRTAAHEPLGRDGTGDSDVSARSA